jgi:hypothetical protein
MLGYVLAVVLLPLVILVASSTASGCKDHCVKRTYQDQVWTFEGWHWTPGKVNVRHPPYCTPAVPGSLPPFDCSPAFYRGSIPVKKGRFTFRYLVGNTVLPGVGHGGYWITFSQGRHYRPFGLYWPPRFAEPFTPAADAPPTVGCCSVIEVTP